VLADIVYKTQDVINAGVVCDSVEDSGACSRRNKTCIKHRMSLTLLLCVIQWKIVVLAVVVYKTQDVINAAVVCDSVEDPGTCSHHV